jgi:iron complex outermembrane recepter protein
MGSRTQRIVLAAALCSCFVFSSTAGSASPASYRFDIASQSLSQALRAFAQASGQNIVFTEDLVVGLTVPALQGTFTVEAAMGRLLEGTGLGARRSASGALMIVRLQT